MKRFRALLSKLGAAAKRWRTILLLQLPGKRASKPTKICYAGVVQRSARSRVSGGAVKLSYLARAYPPALRTASLLYLVSSALPPMLEEWVGWAKRSGRPVVVNQNGVAYPAWAGRQTDSINAPLRFALGAADFILYQSDFSRTSSDRFLCVPKAPWEILNNSVDCQLFRPAEVPLPLQTICLLASGSHHEVERLNSAIAALRLLLARGISASLIIAGKLRFSADTPAGAFFFDSIQDPALADRLVILPAYTQQQAPEIYRRAHILVHTKYKDPCPTVVIEALSCGLPVVGSQSGGLPELVGPAGQLLPVPDSWDEMHYPAAEPIADAILAIARDYMHFRTIARQRAIDLFSLDDWLHRHHSVFSRLLDN